MNCALFQWHQIELCLIPTPSNWVVPNSNVLQLNCALFQRSQFKLCLFSNVANWYCALIQWPKIEVCLIPMSQNKLCLIPIPVNWIVPNSNVTEWVVPYCNTSKIELCLNPTRFVRALQALPRSLRLPMKRIHTWCSWKQFCAGLDRSLQQEKCSCWTDLCNKKCSYAAWNDFMRVWTDLCDRELFP